MSNLHETLEQFNIWVPGSWHMFLSSHGSTYRSIIGKLNYYHSDEGLFSLNAEERTSVTYQVYLYLVIKHLQGSRHRGHGDVSSWLCGKVNCPGLANHVTLPTCNEWSRSVAKPLWLLRNDALASQPQLTSLPSPKASSHYHSRWFFWETLNTKYDSYGRWFAYHNSSGLQPFGRKVKDRIFKLRTELLSKSNG